MKLLSLFVVVLVLLLPAPARAQSIKLVDIVGTWVGNRVDSTGKIMRMTNDTLVLLSDSTYLWKGGRYRFRLRGDTLWFRGDSTDSGFKLTLKGQQLGVTGMGTNKNNDWVNTRVGTSTPKP